MHAGAVTHVDVDDAVQVDVRAVLVGLSWQLASVTSAAELPKL